VDEAEVGDYFKQHADEFRVPEALTLRQILVTSSDEAQEVRRRTLKDPKSFDLIARSRSRSPEASTGGLMGTFHRGELPVELEQAAFALPAGATSDVVSTSLGYHVLKVEARQPAKERRLDECRAEIHALLMRSKSDSAVRAFIRGLMAQAKVNHEAAATKPRSS
jgi:parvulin-like peptidyl-prolyl isomerase